MLIGFLTEKAHYRVLHRILQFSSFFNPVTKPFNLDAIFNTITNLNNILTELLSALLYLHRFSVIKGVWMEFLEEFTRNPTN